jgi:hypothetical protein
VEQHAVSLREPAQERDERNVLGAAPVRQELRCGALEALGGTGLGLDRAERRKP